MKKILRNTLGLVGMFAVVISTALADSTTYNPVNTVGTISQLQRGAAINKITIANAAAAAVTVKFYDAPTNTLTYIVNAYTNSVVSSGSVITTYTNILGRVESRTNTVLTTTLTPTSAITNNYKLVYQAVVPATSTLTHTPVGTMSFGLGVAINNSITNLTATIDYTPLGMP